MTEEETYDPTQDYLADFNVKLRDMEEKENLLKDRVVLIGENLIAEKEDVEEELTKVKSHITTLTNEIKKLKLTIDRLIESQNNFARKTEVKILKRQFEMFDPLKLARMSDVKDMIKEALKKKKA